METKTLDEENYLNLVKKIIFLDVKLKENRTNIKTKHLFNQHLEFSLKNNSFPLLTTKFVKFDNVLLELLWFISGNTDSKKLAEQGVNIWNENGSRKFLDNCGFKDREEGDLGPVYGFQWNHFGASYKTCKDDYSNQGINQLENVINLIKTDPTSRRIILTAWNPKDISNMVLPPCHCFVQFFVEEGELICLLFQRSGDLGLGVPYNIASYALFVIMLAHVTNLKPGKLYITFGDAHVYENHFSALEQQVKKTPLTPPTVKIVGTVNSIYDFKKENFVLENYNHLGNIKLEMAL